jgi:MauM/NapG family ferredoxin protein
MSDEEKEIPHNRRSMFRIGFKKLMDPLADYIVERIDMALPPGRTVLRPPGAVVEKEFLETCYRCGNCVEACPATAIRRLAHDDPNMSGTPYIDPDLSACVVCEELACMRTCPSGALQLVADPKEIDMGLAKVDQETCVRSSGEDCRLCVEKCPLGSSAIQIDENGLISVLERGCVGCGVCQFYCPTTPKAIIVEAH